MPRLSMAAGAFLSFTVGCGKAPETPANVDIHSKEYRALTHTAVVLGENRTIEKGLQSVAGSEQAKAVEACLAENPDLAAEIAKARLATSTLIKHTTYSQCDPGEKSKTDLCRTKALTSVYCPNEVVSTYRWLTGELTELDWCARLKQGKKINIVDGGIDMEEDIRITSDDIQGWSPKACTKNDREKPSPLPVASGAETILDWGEALCTAKPKTQPVFKFPLTELDRLIITFSTTDAVNDPKRGPEVVNHCMKQSAETFSPVAQSFFYQQWEKYPPHTLFWLDAKFRRGVGEDALQQFYFKYKNCLEDQNPK
jgi:hypothetical protein